MIVVAKLFQLFHPIGGVGASGRRLTLVVAVVRAVQYDVGGGFQFTEQHEWINVFGAHYALGVDGLGLLMVLLTAVLVPIVMVASWQETNPKADVFFAWTLVLEAFSIAVFAATDVFLFYIVFEAMLIPMYFIIGSYGGAQRSYAAVKFLLYSLVGGLLMLAAVIGLYVVSDGGPQAFQGGLGVTAAFVCGTTGESMSMKYPSMWTLRPS